MGKSFEWRHTACAALGAAMLAPLAAAAQSGADDWKFRASLYGWLPSLDIGTVNFGDIQVDADDIIDSLQFTAMATLQARNGRWGAFTDVINVDLENGKSGAKSFTVNRAPIAVPVDAILTANLEMKGWVWTLAAQYAAIEEPSHELNVFGGFRYLTMEQDYNWTYTGNIGPIPLGLRTGARSADGDLWDAIVGVHGTMKLGNEGWFVPYYLDIGTGDSDFTWQAMAGVGYAFKWGNVVATYRYLDYEVSEGKVLSGLSMYGPLLGVTFRF